MNLQQIRYVVEVVQHNLNVSEAADALFTSQPGVSKQIRALEQELGVDIFVRHGKRFTALTEPGRQIVAICERMLAKGIICKDTHGQTIRLAPPLVITREELDLAVDALAEVLVEARS